MIQTIVLALIQSATEFLPVSSSAHLIIVPYLASWKDQGAAFDVAMHLGTLIAVIVYFRKDVINIISSAFLIFKKETILNSNIFLCLLVATIPALLFGFFIEVIFHADFRNVKILAIMLIVFGIILFLVDKLKPQNKNMKQITLKDALLIGLAQSLALIPGTSRSGISITMARFLGFNREDAARFSMLLSIPTILAAGAWTALKLFQTENIEVFNSQLFVGMIVATLGGMFAIWFLLAWLKKASFGIFAAYRIVLGGILLFLAL